MSEAPVVAIDGPSGSGKGTVCALLAAELGWHILDSGALYRIVGWAAGRDGIALDAGPALAAMTRRLEIEFGGDGSVRVDGAEVGDAIRADAVGVAASKVAALPEVRDALLDVQRAMRRPPGLVADGRDMGTIVFADAALKIFLDASVEERARRRHKQLKDKGLGGSLPGLLASIRARDERDRNREVSPLRPAEDAVVIDSTDMSIEAVLEEVLNRVRERRLDARREL